jgi:hypothetical protein
VEQYRGIALNLMMAGMVFAGLSAVYKVRLFTVSPTFVWAWAANLRAELTKENLVAR